MKKVIINVLNLLLIVTCLIATTYGWWINGSFGSGVIIKSAKIDSEILLEKGADFNRDGILDVSPEGTRIFEEVLETTKGTEQVLIMDLENICPTEVFTFRITVTNRGDVAGYVYANLYEELDFTDGISKEEEFLKFMSISMITYNEDGSKNINKKYLNGLTSQDVLFGGTENELVNAGGESIQIEFIITFEMIDDLIEKEICNEADREYYQKLQGKSFSGGFKFLDISLSSYQPEI